MLAETPGFAVIGEESHPLRHKKSWTVRFFPEISCFLWSFASLLNWLGPHCRHEQRFASIVRFRRGFSYSDTGNDQEGAAEHLQDICQPFALAKECSDNHDQQYQREYGKRKS